MAVFLKWPISVACPSELDLGAVCWRLAPAVPAEFISGHNYQWQCLREEVVSLTDRQQNIVDRTMVAEAILQLRRKKKKKKDEMSWWTKPQTSDCAERMEEAVGQWMQHVHSRISTHSVKHPKDCHWILNVVASTSWGFKQAAAESSLICVHVAQDFSLLKRLRSWKRNFRLKPTIYPEESNTLLIFFLIALIPLFVPYMAHTELSHLRPKAGD